MNSKAPPFPSKIFPQTPKFYNLPSPSVTPQYTKPITKISCTNKISDAVLVAELAAEKLKMKTQLLQREEALKKSRDILFQELCKYLGMGTEEVKQKWSEMDEQNKLNWAKGFVSEWGESFHPLSSKSVKQLVDEKFGEENNKNKKKKKNPSSNSSLSFTMFPSLKSIIGFSQDDKQK